jgi:hypothetical protein
MRWPGTATLEVSLLWLTPKRWAGDRVLNGTTVAQISPALTSQADAPIPKPLSGNAGIVFKGPMILGIGFVVDQNEARTLLATNQSNADVLFPYLSGQDINASPDHSASRWAIWFKGTLEEAAQYPECLDIVRQRVKPERDAMIGRNQMATQRGTRWWRYAGDSKALYDTIVSKERVLAASRHSHHWCLAFVPTAVVFSDALNVFAFDGWQHFGLLQSSVHELWARAYSSTLETRMRYTPGTCFDTFPFPYDPCDEGVARDYYEFRAALMKREQMGMTELYNRFHSPSEDTADLGRLRSLRAAMDTAVLAAYGWLDISCAYGFHATSHGLRYGPCEAARREIHRRLLLLNHERAGQRVDEAVPGASKAVRTRRSPHRSGMPTLPGFDMESDDE